MDIILKPELEKLILAKVNSGKYTTVDEVITVALQLLDERDKHYQNASNLSYATVVEMAQRNCLL